MPPPIIELLRWQDGVDILGESDEDFSWRHHHPTRNEDINK
jgi:hypothetical protein